jgi:aspartate-semialdehyde dehydrogenase
MKVAVVGVTGLVGRVMNEVLEEFDLEINEYIPVASARSVGKKVKYKNKEYTVVSMEEAVNMVPDIAIFSAGGSTSLEWAPKFAEKGTVVIDNSSAWRMDPQMVVALAPLHKKYGIKRLVISTYQSFTGTGAKAVAQYEAEKAGTKPEKSEMAYHYQIFENAIPQCDVFLENKYTKEEMKLVHETKKILGDDTMRITATAVRIPVNGGHSESVNVELKHSFDLAEVVELLKNSDGVTVLDDIESFQYPMPLFAKNKNDVFVGRIRRDESVDNGLNLWIVADNLRKGAATNAVQIAEYLVDHKLV